MPSILCNFMIMAGLSMGIWWLSVRDIIILTSHGGSTQKRKSRKEIGNKNTDSTTQVAQDIHRPTLHLWTPRSYETPIISVMPSLMNFERDESKYRHLLKREWDKRRETVGIGSFYTRHSVPSDSQYLSSPKYLAVLKHSVIS